MSGEVLPVYAVHIGYIEALTFFAHHIVEHGRAFGGVVECHGCAVAYGRQFVALGVEFAHRRTQHEECLAVLVACEVVAAADFGDHAVVALAQVEFPQLYAVLGAADVVEFVAVGGHGIVCQRRGHGRHAYHAVGDAVFFDFNGLGVVGFGVFCVFVFFVGFFLIGLGAFVLAFLDFFVQCVVFGRQAVAVVGVLIEEADEYVVHRAPGGVVAHSVAFAHEGYGIAVKHPFGIGVGVSAGGDIDYLGTLDVDDGYIHIGFVLAGDDFGGQPFAVGAPYESDAAVTFGCGGAVCEHFHFLGLEVHHGQFGAVVYEGHFPAVGRDVGTGAFVAVGGYDHGFFDGGGVLEVDIIVGTFHHGAVYGGVAVTLACVVESLAVGGPAQAVFGFGGMRNLLGGSVFHGGHEDIAAIGESHALAIGCDSGRGCAGGYILFLGHGVVGVDKRHFDTARSFVRILHGVYLAVVPEAEGAVGAAREEAHGIALEGGDALCLAYVREGSGVDVDAVVALALAQEVEAVAGYHGIAVFAGAVGEVGMASGGTVIQPQVARDAGGVVLAPLVFKAFYVLIHKGLAFFIGPGHQLGGRSEHLHGSAARDGNLVELGHARGGEHGACRRGLDGGGEVEALAVGREGFGSLGGAVGGQALRTSAASIYHKDI